VAKNSVVKVRLQHKEGNGNVTKKKTRPENLQRKSPKNALLFKSGVWGGTPETTKTTKRGGKEKRN